MNIAKKLATGLVAVLMLASVLPVSFADDGLPPESEFDSEPLPVSFNLFDEGRMTPAKSQGGTGLCWAFGALSTVESAILTAGLARPDELDLSEGAVAYFMYPLAEEFESDSTGDGLCITHGYPKINFYMACSYGGDPRLAFSMFANGEALIDEAVSPIITDSTHLRRSLDNFLEFVSAGRLDRSSDNWLLTGWNSFDEADAEEMKRAIRKYGGLNAGIFCKTDGILKHRDTGAPTSYFSSSDPASVETNHCVVLIGWDDDYSRDNFGKYKPEHDGAWLALDSTDALSDETGLMYISYDDFIQGYWTVEMCRRGDYGDILYYDYCPLDSLRADERCTAVANVFTAPSGKALRAVGVTTLADDQLIEIRIFVNPDGDPDGGHAAVTQKACPARKGYHVIELDKPATLSEGDTFSIVIAYYADSGGQSGCAPVESGHLPDFELPPHLKNISEFRIAVHPGESFVMHGGKWHDLADEATAELFGKDYPIGNIGIKALLEE